MKTVLISFNEWEYSMIRLGADPEVFAKQGGEYVSAYGMIPGTKDNPHVVNRGAVQVDGMALEFNIDPADSEDEFILNIDEVMAQLRAMVPDVTLHADPVATFTKEYMEQQHPKAVELGCDPDYNAWTDSRNPIPDGTRLFRTGAGHVHCGWIDGVIPSNHEQVCQMMVRQMDFYLGLPSLLYDTDTQRRELYGKAGAYRVKKYGVEYRTLSNRWLMSDTLKRWVYRNSQLAWDTVWDNDLASKYGDIQGVINNSDVRSALEIINAEGIPVPEEYRHVA